MIEQIRNEINDYIHTPVELVKGYTFDTYSTIKRIHLYENRLFEDDSQYMGVDKLFFDAIKPHQEQVARYLDIDTKDVVLKDKKQGTRFRVKLLEHELKGFLDKHNYPELFNQFADSLTTYGTLIVKTLADKPEILDLRNTFFDPTVDKIKDSRFIIIKHSLNTSQLRKYAKNNNWDMQAVERLIQKKKEKQDAGQLASPYEDEKNTARVRSTLIFEVYERWGLAQHKEIYGGKKEDEVLSLFIVAEPYFVSESNGNKFNEGEVLYKDEWRKELPFEDTHLIKIKGRYLGVGIYELLFTSQERINELSNQRRISMELSSIHLFQTSDATAIRNLRTDYVSGDVVKTKQGGINPIQNEERNLSAFQYDEQQYTKLSDALSKASEMIQGVDVASTTPATNMAIQNNNFVKVQMRRRQNFANFVKQLLKNHTVPKALKDANLEHIIAFDSSYDEINAIHEQLAIQKTNQMAKEKILKGEMFTQEVYDFYLAKNKEDIAKTGQTVYIKALRDTFRDLSYDLNIMVDNESEDVSVLHNNYMEHLRILGNNPGLLDDPVAREVYMDVASRSGIDVNRLELAMAQRKKMQPAQDINVNKAQLQTAGQVQNG